MRDKGRGNEAEGQDEEDRRKRQAVVDGRGAEEEEHGRVDKVVPEIKNRKRDENEDGNKDKTSLASNSIEAVDSFPASRVLGGLRSFLR